MYNIEHLLIPNTILVSTIHVLSTGEIVESREGFEKVQDRFAWADKSDSIQRIIKLRGMTDADKKSIIVFYEKDQLIKEYINVERNFKPLAFA
jgi:hypothetical protein